MDEFPPDAELDEDLPHVIKASSKTSVYDLPMVKRGELILQVKRGFSVVASSVSVLSCLPHSSVSQDKSSCMPPAALLLDWRRDIVELRSASPPLSHQLAEKFDIIDCCAAPGNKTRCGLHPSPDLLSSASPGPHPPLVTTSRSFSPIFVPAPITSSLINTSSFLSFFSLCSNFHLQLPGGSAWESGESLCV